MRKTKKYKCTKSNMMVSGKQHVILYDLYGQWHLLRIVKEQHLRERQLLAVVIIFIPIYIKYLI